MSGRGFAQGSLILAIAPYSGRPCCTVRRLRGLPSEPEVTGWDLEVLVCPFPRSPQLPANPTSSPVPIHPSHRHGHYTQSLSFCHQKHKHNLRGFRAGCGAGLCTLQLKRPAPHAHTERVHSAAVSAREGTSSLRSPPGQSCLHKLSLLTCKEGGGSNIDQQFLVLNWQKV